MTETSARGHRKKDVHLLEQESDTPACVVDAELVENLDFFYLISFIIDQVISGLCVCEETCVFVPDQLPFSPLPSPRVK